jgi:hypothetical protein
MGLESATCTSKIRHIGRVIAIAPGVVLSFGELVP